MITETRSTDSRRPTKPNFSSVADHDSVVKTMAALEANGITAFSAADAEEAKKIVLSLIPEGAEVYRGASATLDESGISAAVDSSDRFKSLKPLILAMDRNTQDDEIRRIISAPDVMLGSAHAVTETGSLIAASMGGSQLGPYISGADKVIFVVGTQKIVSNTDEGLRRVYEHALPLESARVQAAYGIESAVNKLMIINREIRPGRITVVLVNEAIGF